MDCAWAKGSPCLWDQGGTFSSVLSVCCVFVTPSWHVCFYAPHSHNPSREAGATGPGDEPLTDTDLAARPLESVMWVHLPAPEWTLVSFQLRHGFPARQKEQLTVTSLGSMCDTPVLSPRPTHFPKAEDTGQKFDKVFILKGSLMLHETPSPGSPDGSQWVCNPPLTPAMCL